MLTANLFFELGNLILLIGTFPLIMAVVKNRSVLKGYNFIGSTAVLTGCLMFFCAYQINGDPLSQSLGLPTILYWALVSICTARDWFLQYTVKLRRVVMKSK
jgi:Na+/melibiose symporter-like transporter